MGSDEGLHDRLSPEDEACFPNLRNIGYRVNSVVDPSYNCVAYAAGDKTRKWDDTPIPSPGYYWPPGAARGTGVESLRSAFEAIGYTVCVGGDFEDGFEKVALYVDDDGDWSHAAHQESNGQWTSKLGEAEDIIHRTPHCFGGAYGNVVYFMKRPLKEVSLNEQGEGKAECFYAGKIALPFEKAVEGLLRVKPKKTAKNITPKQTPKKKAKRKK